MKQFFKSFFNTGGEARPPATPPTPATQSSPPPPRPPERITIPKYGDGGTLDQLDKRLASELPPTIQPAKKAMTHEESNPLVEGLEHRARTMAPDVKIDSTSFQRESVSGMTHYGEGAITPMRGIPSVKPAAVDWAFISRICPLDKVAVGIDVATMKRNRDESERLYAEIETVAKQKNSVSFRAMIDSGTAVDLTHAKAIVDAKLRVSKNRWKESLNANVDFFVAVSKNVTELLHNEMERQLHEELMDARGKNMPWHPSVYLVTVDAAIQILNSNTDALRKGFSQSANDFCWSVPAKLMAAAK